jgi:uncharacterized protein
MARPYRVLSLDGGGIRGVLPATVLATLEDICEKPIAELFDLIVGTSTGGILGLGLSVPGPDGQAPKHSAQELLSLYGAQGEDIFPGGGPPNWKQRIFGTREPKEWLTNPRKILNQSGQRGGAFFGGNVSYAGGARYFTTGLEDVLNTYIGDAPLSSALTDVVLVSYDMASDTPVLFSSRPRDGFVTNAEMRLAARATSAGPTYFEPQPLNDNGTQRVLVDGGVYLNNPALLGYLLSERAAGERPLALVSLGTGTRDPAKPRTFEQVKTANWLGVVQMVMQASMTGGGALVDRTLSRLLVEPARYWRFQTTLGSCNFAMDDSSDANVACLKECAAQLVAERLDELRDVTTALLRAT